MSVGLLAARFRRVPGPKRHGPVRWLHLPELIRSGREVATATKFAKYADGRTAMADNPSACYDLTTAKGIDAGDPFVLDYLSDTGDGFNATYAMARCLTGIPLVDDDEGPTGSAIHRPADLLVLGGDEVYPVASVPNYDERLKYVFQAAESLIPFEPAAPRPATEFQDPGTDAGSLGAGGYPKRPRYVAAIPGNHDWYDGLTAFRQNFCASWIEGPSDTVEGDDVVPRPTLDILLGRYPFQSRSYFAVKLPHNWWLWGIDIQLDAHLDDAQLVYFRHARDILFEQGGRVILCTARPAWVDPPEPDLGYECNRGRLAWFVNRMFGNNEGPDPDTGVDTGDHLDRIPLVMSGDKHHYVHHTRDHLSADDAPGITAPEHLVTCGGGGAYLSSTHHADSITVPWHLSEEHGTPYRLSDDTATFPTHDESRGELSHRFYRIPFVNGFWTPALVVVLVALVAVMLLGLGRDPRRGWWVAAGAAGAMVAVITIALALAFKPGHLPKWRGRAAAVALGLGHAVGYVAAAAAAVGVALLTERGFAEDTEGAGWVHIWVTKPADNLWDELWDELWERPEWPLLLSAILLVGAALFVFAVYWLVADRLGWHQNEFFAGMRLDGYKSFVRIVICPPPPDHPGVAGGLTVTVYGVREVERNRRRAGNSGERFLEPNVEVIDSWLIDPISAPPVPTTSTEARTANP